VGYRGKTEAQERARDLRAHGWTYAEICAELGVARSSVSLWVRDVAVDPRLLEGRRRARYLAGNLATTKRPSRLHVEKLAEIEHCREEAAAWLGPLSERDLFIAGIALYAGEGAKTDGAVKFANSDPRMIEAFLLWLRLFFEIDESRLRLRLYLHEGLDLDAAFRFWSKRTAIPVAQFLKPYRAVADPSIRLTKHPRGCPAIVYSCAATHRRIMGLTAALLSSAALSGVAQLAEHAAVNRGVESSSLSPGAPDGAPAGGAIAALGVAGAP
jgi:transcriptional regulator with XRE-family HTH domain